MIALGALNTLAVPALAKALHPVESVQEMVRLWQLGQEEGWLPRVLGAGSNVVLADEISTPLCLMRIRGIETTTAADGVHVRSMAGENWHTFVRWCLGRGLSGIENLALIPGSVGAAPVQNIGAYGVELSQRFVAAEVLELATGTIRELGREDMAFGYRTSLLKGAPEQFVVLSLTLRLDEHAGEPVTGYRDVAEELHRMGRSGHPSPTTVAEAVIRVRRRKLPDPRLVPNAGSFFKNPVVPRQVFDDLSASYPGLVHYPDSRGVKLAAAQLIEACMNRRGDRPAWATAGAPVRVWERQPLVLTNPGRKSAAEVLHVAGQIQSAVENRFAVRLQMEPDLIADQPSRSTSG